MVLNGKAGSKPAHSSQSDPNAALDAREAARRRRNPYIDLITTLPDHIMLPDVAPRFRGRWQDRFAVQQPLFLDLGSGMGHFLTEHAQRRPDHNFIGIELKYKRLYRSAQKAIQFELPNVQYVRFDVLRLDELFAKGELSGVYINYPDPWPKDRHNERRMVSPPLVRILERVLMPGGFVQLKSDWEPYRKIFPEAFEGSAFERADSISDLDEWARDEENVATSYERRFRQKGLSCFFIEYRLKGRSGGQ